MHSEHKQPADANLTGRSFKHTRPENYAQESDQQGAKQQLKMNRQTTYQSGPVAEHSEAPASHSRLPRTKQSAALQGVESV